MAIRKWGPERLVNTSITGSQINPNVTALRSGGFVVTWTDDSPADARTRFQIFDATGKPVGPEGLANNYAGDMGAPTVIAQADGGFVIVNEIDRAVDPDFIVAQRFTASGGSTPAFMHTLLGGVEVASPTASATGPNGQFGSIVAWTQFDGFNSDIYIRGLNTDMTERFTTRIVNEDAGRLGFPQTSPAVASNPIGNSIVVWLESLDGAVRGRMFDSSGNEVVSEFSIAGFSNSTSPPKVVFLSNYRFVVTWTAVSGTGSLETWGRIFDFDGFSTANAVTAEFLINSQLDGAQYGSVIAAVPGGNFVVAWSDNSAAAPDSGDAIHAQLFSANGQRIGSEIVVNTITNGVQAYPSITALADGRLAVTYYDNSGTGGAGLDIRVQIIDPRDGIINGTGRGETFYGNPSLGDEISAGQGNDVAYGMAGNDVLLGADGNDRLVGGLGDDRAEGSSGDDWMAGGENTGRWGIYGGLDRVGDFNGDGRADIIELAARGNADVWLSSGTSLHDNTVWSLARRQNAIVGDFNGDGRDDLFQLNTVDNSFAHMAISQGADFFAALFWGSGFAAAADGPSQITRVADFNGDGNDDVLQMTAAGTAYVWTSTGFNFSAYAQWGSGGNLGIRIADFNGDGRADLFKYPGTDGGQAQVALSNGTSFGAYTNWGGGFAAAQDGPGGITRIGNVGGPNGFADVVQISASGGIYVWTANAGGTGFNAYANWGAGATLKTYFADMNGDGRMDLLKLPSLDGGQAQVALSTGSGYTTFANWGAGMWAEASEGGAGTTQVADFNGDGKADVMQLSTNGRAYTWLTNNTGTGLTSYTVWGTGQTKGDSAGNDTFVFASTSFGKDVITDFTPGAASGDVIELAFLGNFQNVLASTVDDGLGNTSINFDAANQILLLGVTKAQLTEDDFRFI